MTLPRFVVSRFRYCRRLAWVSESVGGGSVSSPAAYCPKNMCFPGMLSTAERVNLQDLQALSRVTVRFRCGRHAGEVRCLPQPTVFQQMVGSSVHEDGRFSSGLSQRLASVIVMCCKSLLTFALR